MRFPITFPMLKGFKQFVLRGNVIDLAVGVIIGAAFNSVVNSLVKDILTPFLGIFIKSPEFANWSIHIRGTIFPVGDFLNSLLSFLIEAAAVYFFVVLPINTLINKARTQPPVEPDTQKCPYCLSEIPKAARKCAFCTSQLL
jgi:large conductance mechanosensitive channel